VLEVDWLMQWSAGKGRDISSAMLMVVGLLIRPGLYGPYETLRLDELPGGELN
jgi:hypothetical protein